MLNPGFLRLVIRCSDQRRDYEVLRHLSVLDSKSGSVKELSQLV